MPTEPLLDDATLVARAQDGDVAAFEELVRRHHGRAYSLAVHLLGDREEAADAVQESFVAVWRRLPTFRGDAAFGTWLHRIVTNRCLNSRRARRAQVSLDAGVDGDDGSARLEPVAPQREQPDQAAQRHERARALAAAVAALPPEQRACWVLRELEGHSYEEVAEILGVSQDTVRGRLHRARARLAEVMRPWR